MALLYPARSFLLSVAVLAVEALSPGSVSAALSPVAAAPGIHLIPASEVLAQYVERDQANQLYFVAPDGSRTRLITSIEDPEISNRGAGTFFPAETEEVEAALQALPAAFLRGLEVEIFVLPYPRSGQLASSAVEGAIFLSPGVRLLEPRHVHFLLAHEIGHAVHRRFMPDTERLLWSRFAEVRGITDESRFSENAAHAFRPHEIFAEDFRVLFGGSVARGDGTIENSAIPAPESVPGLRSFFTSLLDRAEPSLAGRILAAPNPVQPGGVVTLAQAEDLAASIGQVELVGVSGRSLGTLDRITDGSSATRIRVPRVDAQGRELAMGAYWLRIRFQDGSSTAVPLRLLR